MMVQFKILHRGRKFQLGRSGATVFRPTSTRQNNLPQRRRGRREPPRRTTIDVVLRAWVVTGSRRSCGRFLGSKVLIKLWDCCWVATAEIWENRYEHSSR